MKTIRVALGERSYPIAVRSSYRQLPQLLDSLRLPRHGCVVSHERLLRRHGRGLLAVLRRAGWRLDVVTVPETEASKSWAMARQLISRLAATGAMRPPVLFAFGGGVVGDLTGFVAAIYRRGVPYVQLPTTLLAQVDSAIGGKAAIDLPQAKNFVGAFHQPRLVYSNIGLLRTLPLRQRRSGLGEVIKYGAMADPALFAFLEQHLAACLAMEPRAARVMVERSSAIKARIVSQDERDARGIRAQLNFGHTLGHALEAAGRYRRWTHGEAIAIGMCAAAQLSVELGRCPRGQMQRLVALLQAAGLPTRARGVSRAAVRRALAYDKKNLRGRPRWVLLRRLGRVVVSEAIPPTTLQRVVSAYIS